MNTFESRIVDRNVPPSKWENVPNLWLHLFHGRDTTDEEMDDWGFDGPTLGPFSYIHTTYGVDVKFAMDRDAFRQSFPDLFEEWSSKGYSNVAGPLIEHNFSVVDGCLEFQGKYYGDWSVFTNP